ncbi:Cytochrome bo(3) ubiquinol oxidase subunit 4 [Buchnera aphidicola (Cinara pseudotaxifoliae)]|uniref:Cytochrome bo(3) ubiquinol oxidase subunit 4 n=1 Tax=Buchnera aphidicola (Cinara pseudotaxifoliae) TaxID=655384 RepID=A0A451DHI8_9GAMM|nr:hypothetical protein [Buchnera aphidicola]VFP86093.1 Cytochrome bo(3) ubiquinol oxidase subunit 4 [Buchnera aphidicola (Cinara pseudotaxifoliae)]
MFTKTKDNFMKKIMFFIKKKFFFGFLLSSFFAGIYCFVLTKFFSSYYHYKHFCFLLVSAQVFFYFRYFLGMRFLKKNIFIISSLIFMSIIISIITIGSLWIFDHLNH